MSDIEMVPITRKEFYLAGITGMDVQAPSPVTRLESYLNDILNGTVSQLTPSNRVECYIAKISGANVTIPVPVTRLEFYLAAIAGMEVDVPDPVTREELFLAEWAGSAEHTYGPAALVSFETSRAKLVKSLLIALQPIQDLHGYDHPWPAGGGKNKLDLSGASRNVYGVTFEDKGQYYWIHGSCELAFTSSYLIGSSGNEIGITIPASTEMVMSMTATGVEFVGTPYAQIDVNGTTTDYPFGTPFTLSSDGVLKFIRLANGYPYSKGSTYNIKVYAQLEQGSTPTTFSPYSNICPINGRTGANAYVSPTQDVADATTYPVTFGGTVYAGTVDVVTGSLKYRPYYASYNGEILVGPWMSSMDEYAPGATPTTGAQVVDLGGAETETQLTAQEVQTLDGTNNVWSDAGDVMVKV